MIDVMFPIAKSPHQKVSKYKCIIVDNLIIELWERCSHWDKKRGKIGLKATLFEKIFVIAR